MATSTHTRRRVLVAMGIAPIAAVTLPAIAQAPSDGDEQILAAWQIRQRALAEIEARGTFYHAETHSPDLAPIFDMAEMRCIRANATTPHAALAQAWIALAHAGDGFTDDRLQMGCLARRADFEGLEPLAVPEMDFDQEAIFQVIRALRVICGEA